MKKTFKLLAVLLLVALTLAACGEKKPPVDVDPDGDELTGHLVIYTSESQDLATELIEKFIDANPKVTYELFRSGTGDVISKIDTELQTGQTEANVVWMADIGYIYGLDKKGLVHHYTPENAKKISDAYKYNDGMAHEVRLIYNVIAYNTTKVTNPPKDWTDMTAAEYNGVFAMANPNYSGGAFTNLVVHVQNEDLVGWGFYDDLKKNNVKFEQSNGNLQTKVSSGEYSAVAIVDFMARNATNEGSPVETVWPASGAVLVPTPIALLSTLDDSNTKAAEAFINFTMEEETQKLFVEQGYIPVNEAAGSPKGAPKVSEIKVMNFDLEYYIENSPSIRTQYEEKMGVD